MKTEDLFGQSLLTGLIFACPLGQAKSNCPFATLRKMHIEQRIEFLEMYSFDNKEKILQHHRNCLCKHDIFNANNFTQNEKIGYKSDIQKNLEIAIR